MPNECISVKNDVRFDLMKIPSRKEEENKDGYQNSVNSSATSDHKQTTRSYLASVHIHK